MSAYFDRMQLRLNRQRDYGRCFRLAWISPTETLNLEAIWRSECPCEHKCKMLSVFTHHILHGREGVRRGRAREHQV